jgi:hypothetical protein
MTIRRARLPCGTICCACARFGGALASAAPCCKMYGRAAIHDPA